MDDSVQISYLFPVFIIIIFWLSMISLVFLFCLFYVL